MTHLAVLPARAYQQAKAGKRASWALSVVTLALLAVSALTFLSPLNMVAFTVVRTIALIALLFTEPVAQVQADLSRDIPVMGIPISSDEHENDDEYPFGNPARVQD
jgi:hypothetical protein